MKDINRLKKFPEYRDCDLSFIPDSHIEPGFNNVSNDQELLNLIFAPDPKTGFPRSDLALVMSKDTAPEVSQYIRDTLMSPLPDSYTAGDDPDLALASVKSRDISFNEYADHLRQIVNNGSQK